MKKFALFIILISFIPLVNRAQMNNENYDRLSLTHILILYNGDRYNREIESDFKDINRSDKYDNHQLSKDIIYLPSEYKYLSGEDKFTLIYQTLQKESIPRDIIEKWYNRKADGSMNLDLIHKRGRYNANDYEFSDAQLTKRGSANLKDYGNKLIDKTYIIVSELTEIKTARESGNSSYHGYSARNSSYVYKLDFNEAVRSNLYDTWIYEDDSQGIKNNKRESFNNLIFPIKFINVLSRSLDFTQTNDRNALIFTRYKSDDELFEEMVNATYEKTVDELSSNLDDFKVKTYIDKKSPLRAKIGLKEGLGVDQRFFVYEYVWNEKLDKAVQKRKAVIRAKTVADNRSIAKGNSLESSFYQTAGWNIEEGLLIEQKNDLGMSFAALWEKGSMGGAAIKIDLRVGRVIGIPSLYLFGDLNFSSKNYLIDNNAKDTKFIFTKFSVGLAKGYNFAYNFEFIPFVSYGMEFANATENFNIYDKNSLHSIKYIYTSLFKSGASLAVNIRHNIQFVATVSTYVPFGETETKNDTKFDSSWNDIFKDRKGLTNSFGLRVLF